MDIIGLGLATVDVLIRLGEMPTWDRCGSISAFGLDGGGPVGTACVAAARLGAQVGYVGTAGSDEFATFKKRSFEEVGVDLSRLVAHPGLENQIVLVYVHQQTGERAFSGMPHPSDTLLRLEDLDQAYLASAQILHLDGFHYQAALQAAQWMHAAGKQVSLDGAKTNGEPLSPEIRKLIEHTDILICGSGFGRSLTGLDDVWQAGEAMLAMGLSLVVQTEGEAGSYTITADERFHTPAFPVPVLDTTGAGDVFHGAFLTGLLRGWDMPTVARMATAVSAVKCMHLGGRHGAPSLDDTRQFLRQRGFDLPDGA